MEDAGVEVERYKIRFSRFRKINHRTHRKLLIIDGCVGLPVASVSPMHGPATPKALVLARLTLSCRGAVRGSLVVCLHGQLD
jgi:hypothetical protein